MAKGMIDCYDRDILCMRPANERRRYNVTSPLIGWVHTQNDPCYDIWQDVKWGLSQYNDAILPVL